MRPLLFSLPAFAVGALGVALALWWIRGSDIQRKWRLPSMIAAAAVVIALTIYYRSESVPVHAYGVFLAIAAFVGIDVTVSRARFAGFTPVEIVDLGMYVMLWGVIGARVFFVIQYNELYFGPGVEGGFISQLMSAAAVWSGGLVFYGGLIGACAYVIFHAFRREKPFERIGRLFDLCAPGVAFGLAFGRIGCFLNGCCYGGASSVPWGVSYPRGSLLWMAVREQGSRASQWADFMPSTGATFHVHPAPLYASLAALTIGAGLSWFFYRRPRTGSVTVGFLLSYPAARFILEGWARGDTPRVWASVPLTISQIVSMAGFAAGLAGLAYLIVAARGEKAARLEAASCQPVSSDSQR